MNCTTQFIKCQPCGINISMLKKFVIGILAIAVIVVAVILVPSIWAKNEHVVSWCEGPEGERVHMVPVARHFLNARGASFGIAEGKRTKDDQDLVVHYDWTMSMLPREFQRFIFYHECAHHELGHTSIPVHKEYAGWSSNRAKRETEADCRALERLKNDGMDDNVVFETYRDRGSMAFFNVMGVNDKLEAMRKCK